METVTNGLRADLPQAGVEGDTGEEWHAYDLGFWFSVPMVDHCGEMDPRVIILDTRTQRHLQASTYLFNTSKVPGLLNDDGIKLLKEQLAVAKEKASKPMVL